MVYYSLLCLHYGRLLLRIRSMKGVLGIVSKSKSSPKFIGPYEVIEKIHIFLFLRLDELRGRNLVLRGVECDRISRVFTHFLLNDINLLQIYMLLISCMSQFV